MEEKEKMSRRQFWVRFAIWVILSLIVPFAFIAVKYGLFSPTDTLEQTQYKMSGWGVCALVVVGIILMTMMGSAIKCLPKYSMASQCMSGYLKLMPLLLLIFGLDAIKNSVGSFIEVLIVVFVTQCVAIPVNPFPRWAHENNVELAENVVSKSIKKAFRKEDK